MSFFIGPITIDNTVIPSELNNYPLIVKIKSSSGITGVDLTIFFSVMTFADRKKIKFWNLIQTTQFYAEIINWDQGTEAIYQFKQASTNEIFYIEYDPNWGENTTYIGDTTDVAAQTVWDSAFKGVYHKEQDPSGSAPQILDSTSNLNHGTNTGSLVSGDLESGLIGNRLNYAGRTGGISLGNDNSLQILGDLSVSAVITSSNSLANLETFINRAIGYSDPSSAHNYNFSFGYNDNGELFIFHEYSGGLDELMITVASYINISTDYTLQFIRDNIAKTVKVFVDPLLVETLIYTNSPTDGNDSIATLGYDHTLTGPQDNFGGKIDEIQISNIVRSDSWMITNYYNFMDLLLTFPGGGISEENWVKQSSAADEDWSLQVSAT